MTVRDVAALPLALTLAGLLLTKDRPLPPRSELRRATGCEHIGEGYVKLPGSDTCIKVSGSSRLEGAVIFGR